MCASAAVPTHDRQDQVNDENLDELPTHLPTAEEALVHLAADVGERARAAGLPNAATNSIENPPAAERGLEDAGSTANHDNDDNNNNTTSPYGSIPSKLGLPNMSLDELANDAGVRARFSGIAGDCHARRPGMEAIEISISEAFESLADGPNVREAIELVAMLVSVGRETVVLTAESEFVAEPEEVIVAQTEEDEKEDQSYNKQARNDHGFLGCRGKRKGTNRVVGWSLAQCDVLRLLRQTSLYNVL